MQKGWWYIKDSGDFIKKTRTLDSIPENAYLVTADIVDLYPSIPHEAGLKALREVLDKREEHTIPTSGLIRMADFVLKNNYFDFNGHIKEQIELKLLFLKPNSYSLWCGLDILTIFFFIWTHGEQELQTFLRSLNEFHTDIKSTYESSKESIAFLALLTGENLT